MNEYYGVYDYGFSDKFRPTLEDRVHKDYPYSKTLCCRDDTNAIMLSGGGKSMDNLKIRKLTPKECGRLMGLKDEDIDKIAKNQSDSSMYHLFGDSIVVNVLIAIFGEMIDDNKRVNE